MAGISWSPHSTGTDVEGILCTQNCRSCGNPIGMDFVYAETMRGCFANLSNDKNLGASI